MTNQKIQDCISTFTDKTTNRYIVRSDDIPSYLFKSLELPSYYYNWMGIKKFKSLEMSLYDPIVPSGSQCVWEKSVFSKNRNFDFKIQYLGPVGDVVSEWEVFSKLKSVEFSKLDYSNKNEPTTIFLRFDVKKANLLY